MTPAFAFQPLPWLAPILQSALQQQRGHALLVHGPAGVGQFDLALALAQAWLCEAGEGEDAPKRPCGVCSACRLVTSHNHPDLQVLLPPILRGPLGWASATEGEGAGEGGEGKASKAKPSKEIKVDPMREAIAFAQSSSARGRAKVVVVHPAERMNTIAANTLLKTLEEPPGMARFILCSGAPGSLLPTVRSRCQSLLLPLPEPIVAARWLAEQGVKGSDTLLMAAGGQPLEALEWSRDGVDAAAWQALPRRLAKGDAAALVGWPLPRAVDALQKLCHDTMLQAAGSAPRYFPAASLAGLQEAARGRLAAWSKRLLTAARQAEHPWNAGLMAEALAGEAQQALRIL